MAGVDNRKRGPFDKGNPIEAVTASCDLSVGLRTWEGGLQLATVCSVTNGTVLEKTSGCRDMAQRWHVLPANQLGNRRSVLGRSPNTNE